MAELGNPLKMLKKFGVGEWGGGWVINLNKTTFYFRPNRKP